MRVEFDTVVHTRGRGYAEDVVKLSGLVTPNGRNDPAWTSGSMLTLSSPSAESRSPLTVTRFSRSWNSRVSGYPGARADWWIDGEGSNAETASFKLLGILGV